MTWGTFNTESRALVIADFSTGRENIVSEKSFKTHKNLESLSDFCLTGNGPCLACVYRVMDAREKLGEHERSV